MALVMLVDAWCRKFNRPFVVYIVDVEADEQTSSGDSALTQSILEKKGEIFPFLHFLLKKM